MSAGEGSSLGSWLRGTDFVDGAVTIAANGSPGAQDVAAVGPRRVAFQDGCTANSYAMTTSMPAAEACANC